VTRSALLFHSGHPGARPGPGQRPGRRRHRPRVRESPVIDFRRRRSTTPRSRPAARRPKAGRAGRLRPRPGRQARLEDVQKVLTDAPEAYSVRSRVRDRVVVIYWTDIRVSYAVAKTETAG
jgi:hypothetical protein